MILRCEDELCTNSINTDGTIFDGEEDVAFICMDHSYEDNSLNKWI